jgi:RimJ/RimL family protein N-acetyltransferase
LTEVDYEDFARLCLDPVRLAALGHASEGTLTPEVLTEEMGVSRRQALETVADLRLAGLVDADDRLRVDALHRIAATVPQAEPASPAVTAGDWTASEVRTLETFFSGERLVEIPANRRKRLVVLERLAQEFEPGVRYAEAEVSGQLERFNPDYAALRRYLVEENLMSRAEGVYWRTGGRFNDASLFEAGSPKEPATVISARGPILATSRNDVILEPYAPAHRRALLRAADDERISRYLSDAFPYPYTFEDADAWLVKCSIEDPPLSFGIFVGDELAGGVGCAPQSGIRSGTAQLGWWLNPKWWGRGVAAVAASRMIDYCFTELDQHRVEALVFVPNTPSARVAEKAGLLLEGVARDGCRKRGELVDLVLYGLARSAAGAS